MNTIRRNKNSVKTWLALIVIIAVFCLILPSIAEAAGWLSGWDFRKKITIQNTYIDSNLTDFPVLIAFDDDGDIGGEALSNGYDLRFTQSDGTTLLKYEREYFDITASLADGRIWVKVPSLLAAGTNEIYIYYGKSDAPDGEDAANVWDDDYRAVWHLGEDYALDFNGTDDYVDAGSDTSLDDLTSYTYTAWIKPDVVNTWLGIIAKDELYAYGSLHIMNPGRLVGYRMYDGTDAQSYSPAVGGTISAGSWQHVAMTYDQSGDRKIYLYVDGAEISSYSEQTASTGTISTDASETLYIGKAGAYEFDGIIDDVRIWNRALSPTEISDLYQGNPVSRTGLVGEWLMNEGDGVAVADSSGQGNNGDMTGHAAAWTVIAKDSTSTGNTLTAYGDPTAGPDGKIGVGVVLDGTGDWLYGNYSNFDNANAGTYEFWLYYDTQVTADGFLISDNIQPFIFNVSGTSLRAYIDCSSGRAYDWTASGSASTGEWMRIVVTANNTIAKLYKNGTEVWEDSTPAYTLDEVTNEIFIGTDRGISNRDVDGTMDEVRISNIARGAAWITASYETEIDHLLDWGGEESPPSSEGIAVDDVSSGTLPPGGGWTLTIEHTVSGTNRLLVVGVSLDNDWQEYVASVTWNGTPLSHVVSISMSDDARAEIWYLKAPETGTYDVVITLDGDETDPTQYSHAGVISFTGVDQTTPLGDTSTYQGDPALPGPSLVVDSSTGDVIFGVAAVENQTFTGVGDGQTAHWLLQSGITGGGGTTKPGEDTSTTISFTYSVPDHVAMVGVAIKPVAAAATGKFLYRKKITIDHNQVGTDCGSDLENFPVLISLTGNWLKTTTADPTNGRIEHDSGYDIVFRAADGITHLDHEKELYDGTNGTLIAWVRIPTLSYTTPDTYIYMYYGNDSVIDEAGNPTGVWDDNYRAVWHLREEYALDFGGISNVNCGEGDNITEGKAALTVSGWVYKRTGDGTRTAIGCQDDVFQLGTNPSGDWNFWVRNGSGSYGDAETNGLTYDTWVHLVGVYDGTNVFIYEDGVQSTALVGDLTGNTATTTNNILLAVEASYSDELDGMLNEVRIWTRALSPTEVSDLYQGNPVSRTGLVGEWLMNEGTGNTVSDSSGEGNDGNTAATWVGAPKDSTQYANHGVAYNSPTFGVAGKIGKAIDFDGADDYIDCGTGQLGLSGGAELTVELWNNWDTAENSTYSVGRGDYVYPFVLGSAGGPPRHRPIFRTNSGTAYPGYITNPVDGAFHHTVILVDLAKASNELTTYVDGIADLTADIAGTSWDAESGADIVIGADPEGPGVGGWWDGTLDEIRISNIDRGACYIQTCFNNQDDPGDVGDPGFYTVGDEEYPAPTAVDIIFFNAIGQDASVLVQWETAQEIDNLGFNLYRSTEPYGSYTKLNRVLIPGLVSSITGRQYSYIDTNIIMGVPYYYKLEDVDLGGKGTMHGPVCVYWDIYHIPDDDTPEPDDDLDTDTGEGAPETGIPVPTPDLGGSVDRVELAYFKAHQQDGGVALEWETSYEVNILGFQVYRQVDEQFYRITTNLLPGSVFKVGPDVELPGGGKYVFWDALSNPTGQELYWLECMDINGGHAFFGPIKPDEYGLPVLEQFKGRFNTISKQQLSKTRAFWRIRELRKQRQTSPILENEHQAGFRKIVPEKPSEPRLQPSEAQWVISAYPAVKISVKEEGWYRVGQSELVAAGLDSGVDPRYLQLYTDGQEQLMAVTGSLDGWFDSQDAIEFYGRGLDTPFTDTRIYWLVAGSRPGKRIKVARARGYQEAPSSFQFSMEVKERTFFFAALKNGEEESFFGSMIWTDPVDQLINVRNLDLSSSEDALLEVALQGASDFSHHIKILLNDGVVGDVFFYGQVQEAVEIPIPQELLLGGDNVVTFVPQGGSMDVTHVDYIRLTYMHTYTADDDVLRFTANGGDQLSITGFSSAGIRVIDITDPAHVFKVRGKVRSHGSSYAITVNVPDPGQRTLLAFTEQTVKNVAGITANAASAWHDRMQGADFVIIAYKDLIESLRPLKELRESQGLSVALIDVEDLYDEFNFGAKSPWALRDFLTRTYNNWALQPRFVMLVGDAHFDPRNYLGFGDLDQVPTKLVDTDYLKTASDDWFVDFDDNGLPEMAMGRLPVHTAEEAATVVNKIISYEDTAGSMNDALLVADENINFDYEGGLNMIENLLPQGMTVSKIFRGQNPTARSDLLASLNQGQLLVDYIGHGSAEIWKGGLFSSSDALNLTNFPYLPFLVSMTCLNGYFHDLQVNNLAEALLKAEQGGAVAVWTSSGLTDPAGQVVMNGTLILLLFNGQGLTLGEITVGAKEGISDPDIRKTWILFGDPTMRIR